MSSRVGFLISMPSGELGQAASRVPRGSHRRAAGRSRAGTTRRSARHRRRERPRSARCAPPRPSGLPQAVEIAHVLGGGDGVAGELDPDVRSPGRVRPWRPEQVADDLAVARGDGPRGVLRRSTSIAPRAMSTCSYAAGSAGSSTRWAAWRCASRRAASSRNSGPYGWISRRIIAPGTVPRAVSSARTIRCSRGSPKIERKLRALTDPSAPTVTSRSLLILLNHSGS